MVGATSDEPVVLPLGQEDGHCVHNAGSKAEIVDMPAQQPAGMEESDNVNLLQLHPPLSKCPPIPVNKCNLESQFSNRVANRSLTILLRGEPFRVGSHGRSSLDFTGTGQVEQTRAAQSHVKFLIQPFEDLGFRVQVVGVISEHVARAAPNATVMTALEEFYRPWLQDGFRVVDSNSQQENWRLAWEEFFHLKGQSSDASFVLRWDVVLKTNVAQLIVRHLQEDDGKMLVPFFADYETLFDPCAPKMSDMFQWVPHQLQRCLADNFFPVEADNFFLVERRICAKLIGAERIGALWHNQGQFSGCRVSTINPSLVPNALYRLAGRPEGQSVTNGPCPFLSTD